MYRSRTDRPRCVALTADSTFAGTNFMNRFVPPLLLLVLSASPAFSQLPQIRITGVFPPGAQQDSTTDLTITAGTDLDETGELVFSHPGLEAVPKTDGNGNPVANQFTVTVAADVPPGLYDVRARGLFGISNPKIFRTDSLPEQQETEPNNDSEHAQQLSIPTVINGRSNGAADVDTYRIPVKAGQTIVVRSEAAAIDSVMQPVLELFDDGGRRIAHDRRRRHQDAVLFYSSDRDQSLVLTVHDTVYGGSNDYVYRLAIDERPLIDFVRPQVVQASTATEVEVFGRYLPGGEPAGLKLHGADLFRKKLSVTVADPGQSVGTDSTTTSVDSSILPIEGNLLAFATLPDAVPHVAELGHAADSTPTADQEINVPAVISGSFERELDQDGFRFTATKGQQLQIDVLAQRLGSTADPLLVVEQVLPADDGTETFKRLAREDNSRLNPGGAVLPTLSPDPQAAITIPADGTYRLRLQDHYSASKGAADRTYSVVIREAQPDFRLVVFESLPSADGKAPPGQSGVSLRKGGSYELPVYAYRSGGHNGEIRIQLENLPPGVTAAPAVIAPGQSTAVLVLTAAADASQDFRLTQIYGESAAGETQLRRSAKIVSLVHDSMNGLARTARITSALAVGVMRDEEPFQLVPQVTDIHVNQDQQLLIPVQLTKRTGFDNKVDLAVSGQPGNTDVAAPAIEKGTDSSTVRLFFKENAAGGPATVLIHGTGQVAYRRNPWLVERANEKVKAAVNALNELKMQLEKAQHMMAEQSKMLADLQTTLKTSEAGLAKAEADEKQQLGQLTEALKDSPSDAAELTAVQQSLAAVGAAKSSDNSSLDATIESLQETSAAVRKASTPLVELSRRLQTLRQNVEQQRASVTQLKQDVAQHKANIAERQQAVAKLKEEVAAAEGNLKAREAEKAAAEADVKKAQDATKPQNKNNRSVAVPIRLHVHPAVGKLTAAVPDGGQFKKGTSHPVKVTIARKNNFAGPLKVSLWTPEGVSSVSSNEAVIAADQTEATVTLSVAADAAPADISHAVFRATAADFNGREAHCDAPVAIKVVE